MKSDLSRTHCHFRDAWTVYLFAGIVVGSLTDPSRVWGDVVRLKNGGEIRGVIADKGKNSADGLIVVKTMTGGQFSIDPSQVDALSQRPLLVEEYLSLERQTDDNINERWTLAEWCREHGLTARRREQLERIIELDPEHRPARVALRHVKVDGTWMTRDEKMKQEGYVKHDGRYVTRQEFEIFEKEDELKKEVRAWIPKIKLWHNWIAGSNLDRQRTAYEELRNIDDPTAIPALAKFFGGDPRVPIRELYIKFLKQMPEGSSVPPLTRLVLLDQSHSIGREALQAIPREYAARGYPLLLEGLRHGENVIVRRAAVGLGAIGDETIIEPLIDALSTKHYYKVKVPDTSSSYSFRSDGGFGGGSSVLPPGIEAMLRAGLLPNGVDIIQPLPRRTKVITIEKIHDNAEVLEALTSLTGENLGYDMRAWKYWLAKQKQSGNSIVITDQ